MYPVLEIRITYPWPWCSSGIKTLLGDCKPILTIGDNVIIIKVESVLNLFDQKVQCKSNGILKLFPEAVKTNIYLQIVVYTDLCLVPFMDEL